MPIKDADTLNAYRGIFSSLVAAAIIASRETKRCERKERRLAK